MKLKKFVLKDGARSNITNNTVRGKVVFINYWFATCAPCIYEIPSLNALYDKFKNNKKFIFLSITYEPDSIIALMKSKYAVTYPIYRTTYDECQRLNGGAGYPTNIIFNTMGKAVMLRCGGLSDYGAAQKFFRLMYVRKLEEILK